MEEYPVMTSMNVSLPDTLKEYVEEQVEVGGYGTASEYLHELIRADKNRKAQERFEALMLEGLESGEPIDVTPEFWEDMWARVNARRQNTHNPGQN
jgi:antitoxin ParD1/3/4